MTVGCGLASSDTEEPAGAVTLLFRALAHDEEVYFNAIRELVCAEVAIKIWMPQTEANKADQAKLIERLRKEDCISDNLISRRGIEVIDFGYAMNTLNQPREIAYIANKP